MEWLIRFSQHRQLHAALTSQQSARELKKLRTIISNVAMMMDLSNDIYNYELLISEDQVERAQNFHKKVIDKITADHMAPLYSNLSEKFTWIIDNELLDTMKAKNKEELDAIEVKIEDATKNAGDTEVTLDFQDIQHSRSHNRRVF